MKRIILLLPALLLMVGMSTCALAHTGTLIEGEIPYEELSVGSLGDLDVLHDESLDNPTGAYKGWWYVNLTNNTGVAWSAVKIKAGAGDLVAVVQGNGLEDEWGFIGNSVVSNKAGMASYSGSLGDRTYDNGAYGLLWSQCNYTFATPIGVGQKAAFKVYTDNSYYQGPFASSFCLCITPTAVPEPSSLLALFGGVAALAGMVRRRK